MHASSKLIIDIKHLLGSLSYANVDCGLFFGGEDASEKGNEEHGGVTDNSSVLLDGNTEFIVYM